MINRTEVLARFDGRCAYCGRRLDLGRKGDLAFQVDHLHPRYLGGMDDPENLVPACRICNRYKDTFLVEAFRTQLSLIPHRLDRQMTYRLAKAHGLIVETGATPAFLIDKEGVE